MLIKRIQEHSFVRRREDVLAKLFISHSDLFDFPVAYTDRPRSSGEIHGLHYLFISKEEFAWMLIRPQEEEG